MIVYEKIFTPIEKLSKIYKISTQQVIETIEKKLIIFFEEGEFAINLSNNNLKKILKCGKFKNQFEINNSSDTFNLDIRKYIENEYLNVPYYEDVNNRPVYGYLTPKLNKKNSYYCIYGPASQYTSFAYSSCTCILKKERIKNYTTFTIGDSTLKSSYSCKCINPKFMGGNYNMLNFIMSNDTLFTLEHGYYIELQINGNQNHTIDNIKEILFHNEMSNPDPKIKSLLLKNKINYKII